MTFDRAAWGAEGGSMLKRVAPLVAIAAIGASTWIAALAQGQEGTRARSKKAEAPPKHNPAVDNEAEVRYGKEHRSTQELGVRIKATSGPVKDVYGTLQMPTPWPEQTVRIIKEDISSGVRNSKEREVGLLKQYLFHIPFIELGSEEAIIFTIEYARKEILPPEDPSVYVIPKKVDKELRIYLGDSPKLDPKSARVTQTLKEIFGELAEGASDWEKVKAIFQWVNDNITRQMTADAGTAEILKNKKANTDDVVATFVALCRAAKVPARMVWCYEGVSAEFYLEDAEGKGRWFPCSYGAENEFGFSTDKRPILLKGDSFRVPSDLFQIPEHKGEQRCIQESLKCAAGTRGAGRPQVEFLRKVKSLDEAGLPAASPMPPPAMGSQPGDETPPPGASLGETQPANASPR